MELPLSMAKLRWVRAINNMVTSSNVIRTWRGGGRLSVVFQNNYGAGGKEGGAGNVESMEEK